MYDTESSFAIEERRINRRLLRYWQKQRGGRLFPAESDINPEELADVWDSVFLVKVVHGEKKLGFRYTYLGDSLIEAYAEDFTGADVYTQLFASYGLRLRHKLEEVLFDKKPVSDDSEFMNRKQILIKYRMCMLPLGATDDKVEYILGGMKWRAL